MSPGAWEGWKGGGKRPGHLTGHRQELQHKRLLQVFIQHSDWVIDGDDSTVSQYEGERGPLGPYPVSPIQEGGRKLTFTGSCNLPQGLPAHVQFLKRPRGVH